MNMVKFGKDFVIPYKTLFPNASHIKLQESVAVSHGYQHTLEGRLKKKRNKLYHQAKQLNSPELHNKFLNLKHSIQRYLRISHQKYLNNIILPSSDNNRHCKQISSHSGKIVLTSHLYLQVQA